MIKGNLIFILIATINHRIQKIIIIGAWLTVKVSRTSIAVLFSPRFSQGTPEINKNRYEKKSVEYLKTLSK